MPLRNRHVEALGLYTLFSGGARKFEPAPKAYALVTRKHDETRIQMVAIVEIPGVEACETAFREFMDGFGGEGGSSGWRETERSCQGAIEPLYQPVMNKETFHATYLSFSPRKSWEYEGRIVLFGIPSAQAQEICRQIAKEVGERLSVDAECFQGTVG